MLLLYILFLASCLSHASAGMLGDSPHLDEHQLALIRSQESLQIPDYLRKFTEFAYTSEELTAFKGKLKSSFAEEEITPACLKDTLNFLNDLEKSLPYTLRVLDALGKPPAHLSGYDFVWLGAFDLCQSIQTTIRNPIRNTTRSFQGQYCLTSFEPITIGICVADTCNNQDVSLVLKMLINPDKAYGTVCAVEKEWTGGEILALIIVTLLVILSILGSIMDCYLRNIKKKKKEAAMKMAAMKSLCKKAEDATPAAAPGVEEEAPKGPEESPVLGAAILASLPDHSLKVPSADGRSHSIASAASTMPSVMDADENTQQHKPLCTPQSNEEVELGTAWKVGMSFSWITNGSKVLDTTKRKGVIHCINGLRVISLFWVMLGHTYVFNLGYTTEILESFEQSKEFTYQAIYNATVSVDTFFFISGLLTTYLTLKQLKKSRGKLNWGLFYFHRFWRLTPVYMFTMMCGCTLYLHLIHGPYQRAYDNDAGIVNCHKYWWANMLYINNFVPLNFGEQCMGWSWYLANDMQFYVISPAFIYLLYRNWKLGIATVIGLLIGSLTVTGVMSRIHGTLPTITLWNPETPFNDYLYIQPQYRIAPYLVGMLTAYLLHHYKGKVPMNKWIAAVGWMLAVACNMAVLYGLVHWQNVEEGVVMPPDLAAFYESCHRFAWSLGLAWLVVACTSGYGGPVNVFLSWAAWIPLVRLSFCAYLLHPMVYFFYYGVNRLRVYNHFIAQTWMFVGTVVITLALSLPVTLLVESPMMGLEKIFLSIGKKPKSSQSEAKNGTHPIITVEMGGGSDNRAYSGEVNDREGMFKAPGGPIKFVIEPPVDPAVARLKTDDTGSTTEDELDEAATFKPKGNHLE